VNYLLWLLASNGYFMQPLNTTSRCCPGTKRPLAKAKLPHRDSALGTPVSGRWCIRRKPQVEFLFIRLPLFAPLNEEPDDCKKSPSKKTSHFSTILRIRW